MDLKKARLSVSGIYELTHHCNLIPKAQLLALAKDYQLLPTTVQKDYVLGWLLRSISQHPQLSKWVFKGGTCLKKCYFETYRFSEDLDFTIPTEESIDITSIQANLETATVWIEENTGINFPREDWKIEPYQNLRGKTSFNAKISYLGPLGGPLNSLPRIKFDLTQDEIIVDEPMTRALHHNYTDEIIPPPQILCYTINEFLAEKTRALVERNGRARDVYDIVNISRNFRDEIDPQKARDIAQKKFAFKALHMPSVKQILTAIDLDTLKANWNDQLAHQISNLPPVETFIDDLEDAIAWWLQPELAKPRLQPMPQAVGRLLPRSFFPSRGDKTGSIYMDRIRQAARNKLCVLVAYHGLLRLVEAYSLRYLSTGNEVLHVWEVEKNGSRSEEHKSYKTNEITSANISNRVFTPKWAVEL